MCSTPEGIGATGAVETGIVGFDNTTFQQEIQIAPEFKLAPGETKDFEGVITIPLTAQPGYDGPQADHASAIRGRSDTFGNDPDGGYQPIKIGLGVSLDLPALPKPLDLVLARVDQCRSMPRTCAPRGDNGHEAC
jgi:hypothetical protein